MDAGKKKSAYDNSSISSLKGEDRVRKRPGVIFGSDGLEGCQHSFFEILSNSIDEAREGYGEVIKIIRHVDKSIAIHDFGRGIPLGYNRKEKRYNWELVYCELYAGGKYNNNDGDNYEYSLGLNGLGACATQYASEWFDVTVFRDGCRFDLHFEKGVNIKGLKKTEYEQEWTGSIQHWKPDLDVFTDINIPLEFFQDVLKKQAVVNAGLKFELFDEESEETFVYLYRNGILDYLDEINEGKAISAVMHYTDQGKGSDRSDKPEYKVKAEVAFAFNNEVNRIEYYHNSSFLEHGGAPDKAVKSAFISEIDKYIKKLGKYQKNEKKISFIDIQDSLVLVVNSFSTLTSYENQTKKAINNKFIQEFLTEFIRHELEIYFIENKMEAERVIDQLLINKRSRENAEKTRLNIRKKLNQKIDLTNRIKKFVDCRTKVISEREIYIVEGDSALGACKLARDAEFQALMPVRGKILNCLKADYDKIFASDIIVDLIKVLGCGIEIKSKHAKDMATFDLDALRWDKVIICTDADVDGFQIRTLILTMLYRLMPTLIEEQKVFIAESPLFEISTKKKTYFAYNEKEKANILEEIGTEKYQLQRSKGLGENEPDMMWETTMCPTSRRLVAVRVDDVEKAEIMFNTLLGDDLQSRKAFIEKHGAYYIDQLDIS
ncbi:MULTISPECIES: type IIA DNA topoisomerase subunit B [unclassified Fusibacter]|uniref:DNA gyrase/topoisomerase IV subunit B n=1 Tax=unclassified Fusibacter TaxID=2624464 RepID=UPI001013B953|nr:MULTISPECIES: toprim domain-containing protein [unclassified Fusibacter]MCK8061295.1 toprim domain-containing protein [Fusibacter sp. A2]NPE23508.1 DNA topoisomerase [Fusibacter sp. A1]RXV59113.1 DNA topoisomerase [Fusibacter sp. A1]